MRDRFLIVASKVAPNGCTTEGYCKAGDFMSKCFKIEASLGKYLKYLRYLKYLKYVDLINILEFSSLDKRTSKLITRTHSRNYYTDSELMSHKNESLQ